eukprot:1159385-Pyramimonas_sp.AAC.1
MALASSRLLSFLKHYLCVWMDGLFSGAATFGEIIQGQDRKHDGPRSCRTTIKRDCVAWPIGPAVF